MLDRGKIQALRRVYERLRETQILWAVTGSLNFALQGLNVEPNDIDLQTDAAGVYEIERRLAEYSVRKVVFSTSNSKRLRSHYGALEIDGVQVEIMGDLEKLLDDGTWEAPPALNRHRIWLEVEGMRLPVLSLEYEEQAYRKLGRTEKADMLRRWLDQHTTRGE